MKNSLVNFALSVAVLATLSGTAQANLINRGNGMIYDQDRNITWLADANYAKTSGFDTDGLMSWQIAVNWANDLVYGGYSDWRLANTNPSGGSPGDPASSDLSHLFYTELGGVTGSPISTTHNANYDLFKNIDSSNWEKPYWSSATYSSANSPNDAFFFAMINGWQDHQNKSFNGFAWAVRDGDVSVTSAVPEAEEWAMMLLGLPMIGWVAKRRKSELSA